MIRRVQNKEHPLGYAAGYQQTEAEEKEEILAALKSEFEDVAELSSDESASDLSEWSDLEVDESAALKICAENGTAPENQTDSGTYSHFKIKPSLLEAELKISTPILSRGVWTCT